MKQSLFFLIFLLTLASALAVEIGPEDPVLGSRDAPIAMVQFSDFEDPFSWKFAVETFPEIKEKYIDTGKVRFVFKDFPSSNHEHAIAAAKAAQCSNEQGFFWLYHDVLYQNQKDLSREALLTYAKDLGMNIPALERCIRRDSIFDEIQEDRKQGEELGITGVPTFFVNEQMISGYEEYETFERTIGQELEKIERKKCTNGCGENCDPYGSRVVNEQRAMYCSTTGQFKLQKPSASFCEDNYECVSGLCSNGKCLESVAPKSEHIIKRLLDWFERVLGI